jgi:Effector-associated domain 5
MIFGAEKIAEIQQRAIMAGLHAAEKRNLLLFGVPTGYVARLSIKTNPGDQTLSDLQTMSTDEWVGEEIPLAIWLRNAATQTKMFGEPTAFFAKCADEAATTPRRSSVAQPNVAEPAHAAGEAKDPAVLDAAQKESLAAAMEACLSVSDLQATLQKCFGDLLDLYAASSDAPPTVRDLAMQSIALVEREKLTVAFLHFVLASARCSAELREKANAMFPELQVCDRPFAVTVDAAAKYLAQNACAVSTLLGDKALAAQLDVSVKELKCYKSLHEAIHQVRNNPLPRLSDDDNPATAREFKQELRQYLALLNTAAGRLQDALDELPPNNPVRTAQQPGITLILGCAKRIEAALWHADIDAADAALEDTARTIDPMLDEFNQLIVDKSKRVLDGPLDQLRRALAERQAQGGPAAVNAMDALRLALRLRVLEHSRWQEVDNSLSSLGRAFRADTGSAFKKFTRRWGVARRQIPILTDSDSGVGTAKLEALARRVDNALVDLEKTLSATGSGDKDSFAAAMLEPFDEFRFETQQQFLKIDSALKRNCAELARVVTTG